VRALEDICVCPHAVDANNALGGHIAQPDRGHAPAGRFDKPVSDDRPEVIPINSSSGSDVSGNTSVIASFSSSVPGSTDSSEGPAVMIFRGDGGVLQVRAGAWKCPKAVHQDVRTTATDAGAHPSCSARFACFCYHGCHHAK
jgi:hypothetical protein